jgi:hypothetical protein
MLCLTTRIARTTSSGSRKRCPVIHQVTGKRSVSCEGENNTSADCLHKFDSRSHKYWNRAGSATVSDVSVMAIPTERLTFSLDVVFRYKCYYFKDSTWIGMSLQGLP